MMDDPILAGEIERPKEKCSNLIIVDLNIMLEIQKIAEDRSRWSRAMRRILTIVDYALGTERCSQGYATERRIR
jgi:hypothetical protein